MLNLDIPTVLVLALAGGVVALGVVTATRQVTGELKHEPRHAASPPNIEAILTRSLERNDGRGATAAWSPKRELATAEQVVIDPGMLQELSELRAATEPAFRQAQVRFDQEMGRVMDRLLRPVGPAGYIEAMGLGHACEQTQEIDLAALRQEMAAR